MKVAPDFSEDDPMLKQTVIRTPAGVAPAQKPAGAVSSVFDVGSAAPPAQAEPARRSVRQKNSRQAVLDALQQGESSGSGLARQLGCSQPTVSHILRTLMAEGVVESNGEPASSKNLRYRLKAKTAAGGFQAWLAKQGEPSAEGRASRPKKELPVKPSEPSALTGHKATQTRRTAQRSEPAPAPTWSCALESSGHLIIRANGQELALDAQQARGVAAWLQRVDAALTVALGAR